MMFAACKEDKDDHQNQKNAAITTKKSPEHVIIHSQKQRNTSARVKMNKKKPVYYTHNFYVVCSL